MNKDKSDLLSYAPTWEVAGYVTRKLHKKFEGYKFIRTDSSNSKGIEIFVEPKPDEIMFYRMQGYAFAVVDIHQSAFEY